MRTTERIVPAPTARLWDAMPAVEPQAPHGALVSVRELRAHLGDPAGFDVAVLALADQGRVALHHCDGEPRWGTEGLVWDENWRDHAGRPGWVIGVAIRD